MKQIKFNFTNNISLVYSLNGSTTSSNWLNLISKNQTQDLLKNDLNLFHGKASVSDIKYKLDRLTLIANFLGFKVGPLSPENWKLSLNKLHLEFPKSLVNRVNDTNVRLLHEMNLTIHWLEQELYNHFDKKEKYTLNLDFNHSESSYSLKLKIPDNELSNFSTDIKFGDLYLHYIFIGRHFLELYEAEDKLCPKTQFRAQTHFNATCGLSFSEPEDAIVKNLRMRSYYDSLGGIDYFGYDYNSDKLCKGFFKLGTLSDLKGFNTTSQRNDVRNTIFQQSIVSWEKHPI